MITNEVNELKNNKPAKEFRIGRPPKFKDPQALKDKIEEYINNPPDFKRIILKEAKCEVIYYLPCFTMCGLALFLGFESRQSLWDYTSRNAFKDEEERRIFAYIITRAKTFIEFEYEKLCQEDPKAAQFPLKQLGWKDQVENVHSGEIKTGWKW